MKRFYFTRLRTTTTMANRATKSSRTLLTILQQNINTHQADAVALSVGSHITRMAA